MAKSRVDGSNLAPTGITDRDCFLSAIRQGIVPFPDELFLSADSRRLAVRKGISDGFFVIPDGFWPTGISLFLVVIDTPNLLQRLMDLESKMKHLVANQTQLYIGLSTKLKPNSCSGFLMVAASSKPDPTNS